MHEDTSDHVTCRCCGKHAQVITGAHLKGCSGLTTVQYRERYPDAPFACESHRRRFSKSGAENGNWRGGRPAKHCKECPKQLSQNNRSGLCRSCASKGERNAFHGRKHDDETRARMAQAHETRDPSTYHRIVPDSAAISAGQKRRWARRTPAEQEVIIQKLIESGRNAKRKQEDTKIEQIVKGWLTEWGVPFEASVQVGRFQIDVVAEKNLGIECNGDFWHANPQHYAPDWVNLETKLTAREKWEKDERRRLTLARAGYHILTLWEEEIHKYPNNARQKLRLYLGLETNEDPDDWEGHRLYG